MEVLIIVAIVCAGIGGVLDGGRGAILGALLGPIGLIITAVMRAGDKKDEKE
jgi:hypothetical protein